MFHFLGFLFIILTYRNENGNYQSGKGYSFNDKQQSASSHEEAAHKEKTSPHSNPRKKLFSQDEGEYVEFEEIKD